MELVSCVVAKPTPGDEENLKFILDGRSFDTTTSYVVAVSRGAYDPRNSSFEKPGSAEEVRFERVLYRTAMSALFIHSHETYKFAKGKPIVRDTAEEIDQHEAVAWIERQGAAVLDEAGLSMPPEA